MTGRRADSGGGSAELSSGAALLGYKAVPVLESCKQGRCPSLLFIEPHTLISHL